MLMQCLKLGPQGLCCLSRMEGKATKPRFKPGKHLPVCRQQSLQGELLRVSVLLFSVQDLESCVCEFSGA